MHVCCICFVQSRSQKSMGNLTHRVVAQNIAFCISNGIRSVDCPRTSFSCRAASAIMEGGNRRDGQGYSSGNFLIKELSTLSHRVAALWIGKHVSIRTQLYYLCSSVLPPFPISASWENKVSPRLPVASTTTTTLGA